MARLTRSQFVPLQKDEQHGRRFVSYYLRRLTEEEHWALPAADWDEVVRPLLQ